MKSKFNPLTTSTAVVSSKSRNRLLSALTVTLCLAGAERSMAQTSWDGGGTSDNFSDAANWVGDADITNINNLGPRVFVGNTRNSPVNNLSNTSPGQRSIGIMTFSNDGTDGFTNAYTVSGNLLNLGGNIITAAVTTGPAINDEISLDLNLTALRTFNIGTNHNMLISGDIGQTGTGLGIIKSSPGTLTLSGANTFSGAMQIQAGTVNVNTIADSVSSALGLATSMIIGNSGATGTLNYTGVGNTTARTVKIGNGGGTNTGGATISANGANGGTGLQFAAAANPSTSAFNTTDTTTGVRSLTLSGSNTDANRIAGVIQNNNGANINVTKSGGGRWILGGENTYSGTTAVSGGVLQLDNASALGGGLLNLNGGVLGLGAGDFTRSIGTAAGEVQMSTNTSGFAAYGADRFVNIGGSSAMLTFAVTNFASNGLSLASSTSTHTLDFQNPLNVAGFLRTINVSNGTSNTNIDAILSGIISSTGGGSPTPPLRKGGSGTLMLTAENTLAGSYQIVNGRLTLGGATGNVIPDTGTVAVGTNEFGTTSNCTFDLNGVSETIGGLTIGDTTAGTLGLAHSVVNTGASAVLTLGGNITYNTGLDTNGKGTISANIGLGTATCNIGVNNVTANPVDLEISGQISGVAPANGLQKNNSGTLLLSASNTYTGGTFINDGTLMITGATQATSSYGFGGAGKLGFNIASPVTAANATVNFTGRTVLVEGTPTLPSYTLLTASSITGTPTLAAPAPAGYTLQVVDNNKLLLVLGGADPFTEWVGTVGDTGFDEDLNKDGVDNGLAWLLGALTPNDNANSLLPAATQTAGSLKLTFDMLPSGDRDGAKLFVEHSSDLGTWSTGVEVPDATGGTAPVTFVVGGTDPLDVEVTISSSEAGSGKLFGRLRAER